MLQNVQSENFTLSHFIHGTYFATRKKILSVEFVVVIGKLIAGGIQTNYLNNSRVASLFLQWRLYRLSCYVALKREGLWKTNC